MLRDASIIILEKLIILYFHCRWLYKNSTVVSEEADRDNPELILAKIIITSVNLDRFKHYFIKK